MSRFSALGHQAIGVWLVSVAPPCITGHLPVGVAVFVLMGFPPRKMPSPELVLGAAPWHHHHAIGPVSGPARRTEFRIQAATTLAKQGLKKEALFFDRFDSF